MCQFFWKLETLNLVKHENTHFLIMEGKAKATITHIYLWSEKKKHIPSQGYIFSLLFSNMCNGKSLDP